MSDPATLLVTAVPNPDEMESMQAYLAAVMPLLLGAGGKPFRRPKVDRVVHGEPRGMVLLMDFASADAASGLFASDDYKALIPVRDKGVSKIDIQIAHAI